MNFTPDEYILGVNSSQTHTLISTQEMPSFSTENLNSKYLGMGGFFSFVLVLSLFLLDNKLM